MACGNNGFHAIVLKAFIGIWSVQEKDWCQNNMNAAYKQLKIHWNLVNHCFEWKIKMKLKKKKKVNIDNDLRYRKATVWVILLFTMSYNTRCLFSVSQSQTRTA